MVERSNHIIDLINFLQSNDQEKINIATSELQEAYKQFDTFNDLFNIGRNNEKPVIRKFAALAIRHMIKIHDLDQEQIDFIKMALLSLIESDPDLSNKRLFCEASISLQSKLANPWEELYNLARNFLTQTNTLNLGLQVWISITEITPEIHLLNYFEDLMNCIIATFETNDAEILINSINLFSELTSKIDIQLFESYETLPQLFLDEASACIKERRNYKESYTLFQCICKQLDIENPAFMTAAETFIEMAVQITASDLDAEIRSTCQPLMIIAPKIFPDNVESQLPIFLQSELSLAVQFTTNDREFSSCDIEFLKDFVYSVVKYIENSSDIVRNLLTFATNNISSQEPDPASLQVALLAMSSITGAASEDFFDNEEDTIGEIILFSLTTANDSFIFDACCEFLISASDQFPQLYQQSYNKIISALFSKITTEPRALQTLDKVIYGSDEPPEDYTSLLSALSSLLEECTNEQYGSVISCMTSVIINVNEINDEIYANMKTMLTNLLSSDKIDVYTQSKIFICFGQLAKIAPVQMQQDAPELLKAIVECFQSNREDAYLNQSVAECIQNIAKIVPSIIQPHLQTIIPIFTELLSIDTEINPENEKETKTEENDDDQEEEEEEEETETIKMQCAILMAISELVTDLPSEMESSVSEIVNAVCHFLKHSSYHLKSSAAKSILLMNDGLRSVSFDTSPLISTVIETIYTIPNIYINVISQLFFSLGYLLSGTSFESLNQEQLESIIKLFQCAFDQGEKGLKTIYSSPKDLDQEILNSLFFCLRMFILTLGSNLESESLSDILISFICPHLESKKGMIKAFIANVYGIMFFVAPSLKQVGKTACDVCFNSMTKKNEDINNILISTLNYVINADKSLISSKQMNFLKKKCDDIIKNREEMNSFIVSTAITTWCSICSQFDLNPPENDLKVVLSLLPPVVDDDDIPFTALFIVNANQKWPQLTAPHIQRIAVNIFASGEWCLRIVPDEVMQFLAQVVSQIDQEQLLNFVNHIQQYFVKIQSNLSRFSA